MIVTLKAKSSSGETYNVDFLFVDGVLSVNCTCKAGTMRMACKHRLSLLGGDQSMLADPSQTKELATVVEWANQVGFPDLLQQLETAEAEVVHAQRQVKKLRKRIGDSMAHGLSRGS